MQDPFLWLEDVEGENALNWVRKQNADSLGVLESAPGYEQTLAAATEIATSPDRVPNIAIRDGLAYNFWQDETSVRGVWRRTTLDSYGTENPDWETLIDFDALAKSEGRNWVFKGANCLRQAGKRSRHCMISLSIGGKDAVETREFDLETVGFVDGGFTTSEAKQGLAWADADTLLVATDWGGDGSTLTESGYPSVVKRWHRGTSLEQAETVFTGDQTDVGVWPFTLRLDDGQLLQNVQEADTFFTSKYWYLPEGGGAPVQWPVPPKSSLRGVHRGKVLVSLEQDWAPKDSQSFSSGDLIAFDINHFLETGELPSEIELVFRPSASQALEDIEVAADHVLVSMIDDVAGEVLTFQRTDTGWTRTELTLPGKGRAEIRFADPTEETVLLGYEDFLTPESLLSWRSGGVPETVKSGPAWFDAEGLIIEQAFASSADGARIPYFVVRREDTVMDGDTPTLLYAYGGFQVSMKPSYSGTIGRLWLEQGGSYVLANIRGGGEYGPQWHQAGLKLERQHIYDDFIAVAEALISNGLTRPERLGIMGGSNGGLLMGVMLNQRPDLWNAVVVQVPLLDMLRYHKLLAGASWVDEYGSPEVAEERAFLETISPYQNFDPAKSYPVPFFVTSTKDDRVHPGHARKMAAKFEAAGLPFYYYENIDGGHAAAADQLARAKRLALEFTYLRKRLMPPE